MAAPQITVTFDPPLASDSGSEFDAKAFDTVAKFNPWGVEANGIATFVGDTAVDVLATAVAGNLSELDFAAAAGYFIAVNEAGTGIDAVEVVEYPPLSQKVWNTGTSNDEAPISPVKLEAKIRDVSIGFLGDLSDLSGSRAFDTAYQNLTGRPFMLVVHESGNAGGNNCTIELSEDGATWHRVAGFSDVDSETVVISALVPYGVHYRASGATLVRWMEII
jgi:hypothetical protein